MLYYSLKKRSSISNNSEFFLHTETRIFCCCWNGDWKAKTRPQQVHANDSAVGNKVSKSTSILCKRAIRWGTSWKCLGTECNDIFFSNLVSSNTQGKAEFESSTSMVVSGMCGCSPKSATSQPQPMTYRFLCGAANIFSRNDSAAISYDNIYEIWLCTISFPWTYWFKLLLSIWIQSILQTNW